MPRQTPNSQQVAQRTAASGDSPGFVAGDAGTFEDYNHPIYFSSRRDPAYRVKCLEFGGTCEVRNQRVRIPRFATAAGGSDGHLGVISQDLRWGYDFWQVRERPEAGGALRVSYGGRTRIGERGADGLGSNATAAHFATSAGVIRPDELKAGLIDHALFMVVECTNGRRVWPAKGPGVGRPCSELGLSNRNAPALGQHYYLQMSDDEIRRLDAPKWQRTILRAMADYGLFVGDTGGNGGWGFKLWSGLSYLPAGPDPWVNLARRFGIPGYPADDGTTDFHFDMSDSVAWSEELRVASPCVSRRSCRSPGR